MSKKVTRGATSSSPWRGLYERTRSHEAAGTIQPVVAERVPLLEPARAHESIERGGYAGKVVLVANGQPGSPQAKGQGGAP